MLYVQQLPYVIHTKNNPDLTVLNSMDSIYS